MKATLIALLLVSGLAACNSADRLSPSAPSPTPLPPPPPAEAPTVSSLSPTLGVSWGGTPVTITGTGFQPGATVTFDGMPPLYNPLVQGSTSIHAVTAGHAAATVDVVVTNPDGQSVRLAGGYTFAPPESFDFNGTWEGGAGPESWDYPLRLTIQNNAVTSVSCGTSGTIALSPAPTVSNGEFSFARTDGVSMSGRIVAVGVAYGRINLAPCAAMPWGAGKQ
jgi:hypothetical protein